MSPGLLDPCPSVVTCVVTCDVTWVAGPLSLLLLPVLLPACVCCARVTVVDVVVVTCLMLPVFRCVACAGCFAPAALLVVTCDVTWAAEPLSVLLLPALLPACVCCARVTVVAVVIVTCDVACLSLRRVRWMFRTRRFVGCYLRCHLGC